LFLTHTKWLTGPKSHGLPVAQENVRVRPSVEAETERVLLEHTPDFFKSWRNPAGIFITLDWLLIAAPPAAMSHAIRGIG
jgi:hypothetical protein